MTTSFSPVLLQLFDDRGDLLAGGKVYTYEAGTSTPLATYQDLGGLVANTNPVVLNSAGRANIRLTNAVQYKIILKDADGNTIATQDNVVVGVDPAATTTIYEVLVNYAETPGAQGWMGGEHFKRPVSFPVDFDGSGGSVITNPGSDYVISVQKNSVEVGTITFDTSGTPTFETTGGATVSFIDGDKLDFYGPDSVGTAANFKITLVGELS